MGVHTPWNVILLLRQFGYFAREERYDYLQHTSQGKAISLQIESLEFLVTIKNGCSQPTYFKKSLPHGGNRP